MAVAVVMQCAVEAISTTVRKEGNEDNDPVHGSASFKTDL